MQFCLEKIQNKISQKMKNAALFLNWDSLHARLNSHYNSPCNSDFLLQEKNADAK